MTYRALFHAAIESKSRIVVPPQDENVPPSTETKEVKRHRLEVRGLCESIFQKIQAVTSQEVPHDEPKALIKAMLDGNMNPCAWTYVASTAYAIEEKALTMHSLCADAGREAMEHLVRLMDERVNPTHVYH